MAISRMQEPQQIQSGIGSLQDPRQGYFLGKIVKKAGRALKKVVKSPIGKMALLGGGAYLAGGFMPGGGGLTGGLGNFRNLGSGISGLFRAAGTRGASDKGGFLRSLIRDKSGDFSLGRAALTGLAGTALAAPFFMGGDDEEEEDVEVMDIANIRNMARNYYQDPTGSSLAFMPQKQFVQPNFYAADGGRAGYADGMIVEEDEEEEFMRTGAGQRMRQPKTFLNMGGGAGQAQAEQMLMAEFVKYKNKGGTLSFEQFVKAVMEQQQAPEGAGMEQPEAVAMAANGGLMTKVPGYTTPEGYNKFDYPSGGKRVEAQEGGIMETEASEMIDMGGMEKDYRNEGGFVAMGGEEKADDVPARLSKNEFVFTADAVRNAGGGDIDKGAEVMENLMNNLEAGGEVSEDSQGLEGAQAMYDQQQMLQSRMI
jgi:hypothetical protein